MVAQFERDLAWSFDQVDSDSHAIRRRFPRAVSIAPADITTDRQGIDYLVRLPYGKTIGIQVKRRRQCRHHWRHWDTPEIALEISSGNRPGWATSPPASDWTLFLFDDLPDAAVWVNSQALYRAVLTHREMWTAQYGLRSCGTKMGATSWVGSFIPVPVPVAMAACNIRSRSHMASL
jgi:hypothetical protein